MEGGDHPNAASEAHRLVAQAIYGLGGAVERLEARVQALESARDDGPERRDED